MRFETVRFSEINRYLGKDNALIVDVRDQMEYKRGHLEYAINIPYEEIEANLELLYPYETIVLYCDRGNLSLRAARNLAQKGLFTINLAGGLRAYRGNLVK
ncbi:rhodanese-like domain-containing protein [Clostridium sp. Marseille-P299]|uniref:rhodanese-like domain-containing protein n=1 Tax=Clostridium sp. Marseille-P299 TaxID=1805477 RepID=UPI00082E8365|nr:rhodanese-like domain-containing protein [Clostridium sp. Marseille-P299]